MCAMLFLSVSLFIFKGLVLSQQELPSWFSLGFFCFVFSKPITTNLSWCGTIMNCVGRKMETVIASYSLHFVSKKMTLTLFVTTEICCGSLLVHKPHTPVSSHTLTLLKSLVPTDGRKSNTQVRSFLAHTPCCSLSHQPSNIMTLKIFIWQHFSSTIQQSKQTCLIWQTGSSIHDNQTMKKRQWLQPCVQIQTAAI